MQSTLAAIANGVFHPDEFRQGEVTGWAMGRGGCIWVRKDGNKYPESFHHTFWETIPDTMSKPHIILEIPALRGQEINADTDRALEIAETLNKLAKLYGPGTRISWSGPAVESRLLARYAHSTATDGRDVNAIAQDIIVSTSLVREDVKELNEKDAWGIHPDFDRLEWQAEVANGDTQLGYWQWVEAKLEQVEFEKQREHLQGLGPTAGLPKTEAFDNAQAYKEGWMLASKDGGRRFAIERLDDPFAVDPSLPKAPMIANDIAAALFVQEKAHEGSEYHQRALRYVGIFITGRRDQAAEGH